MNIKRVTAGALFVFAGALLVTACAASSPRGDMSNVKQRPTFDNPREEIDYLFEEIVSLERVDRGHVDTTSGNSIDSDPGSDVQPMTIDRPDSPSSTAGGGSDLCSDVCNLAASICDNSQRICRLAENLAPDDWAEEKCESATASCETANDNCSACDGD